MGKPTNLFRWADAVGAVQVPPASKQSSGWLYSEKPPPKTFNWLFNGAYQWHAYTNNLHNEVDFLNKSYPWTGAHSWGTSFAMGGGVLSGAGSIDLAGTLEGSGHVIDDPANEFSFKNLRPYIKVLPFEFVPEDNSTSNVAWQASGGLGALSLNPGKSCIFLRLPLGSVLTGVMAWVTPGGGPITLSARREIFDLFDGSLSVTPLGTSPALSSGPGLQLLGLGSLSVPIESGTDRFAVTLSSSIALQSCSGIAVLYSGRGPRG